MAHWTWFDLHWAWIGLSMAAVLLVLLFFTDVFRSDRTKSRWFDPVWLAWLAPAAYMVHQFEEYGIDAHGVRFAFPDLLSASMGMPPYPQSPIPTLFFVAVNIPGVWIAGLVCALLARRHPFVGLGLYGLHFTNALSHLGSWVATGTYNPGAVASAVINLPLSIWVGYACFIRGSMRARGMVVLFVAGMALTVVLMVSVKLFVKGQLSGPALVRIQVLNASWSIVLPWLFEKSVLRPKGATAPEGSMTT